MYNINDNIHPIEANFDLSEPYLLAVMTEAVIIQSKIERGNYC